MGRRAVFYVSLGAAMGLFQWHLVNQLSKQKEKKRRGEESRGRGKGGRESKKREASKQEKCSPVSTLYILSPPLLLRHQHDIAECV